MRLFCTFNSHQLITEVNLAPAVNKMLSNCDEIIRQHKAACLRVTSLLCCKDLIWIGTSAGVLLTIPTQSYEKGAHNIVPTGIPHGHTGHVRFLTFVETPSPEVGSQLLAAAAGRDTGSGTSDEYTKQGWVEPFKAHLKLSKQLLMTYSLSSSSAIAQRRTPNPNRKPKIYLSYLAAMATKISVILVPIRWVKLRDARTAPIIY